jgi:hypothetical protein
VRRFDSGGMSAGLVLPTYWRDSVIPLLEGRYRRRKARKAHGALVVMSLNVAHKTREAPIAFWLAEAVQSIEPDVLVLNEYVDGPSRKELHAHLARAGLTHVSVSHRQGIHNQVLVASRFLLEPGDLRGPSLPGGAGESNFLHVRIPEVELEVVGLRAPMYRTAMETSDYWQLLEPLVASTLPRRILWIGDLNADPGSQTAGGKALRRLRDNGWTVPDPSGGWSFVSGSRIDHALLAPAWRVLEAQYVAEVGGIVIASPRESAISDHAALIVTVVEEKPKGAPGSPGQMINSPDGSRRVTAERTLGALTCFRSQCLHTLTPVTCGERAALLQWHPGALTPRCFRVRHWRALRVRAICFN